MAKLQTDPLASAEPEVEVDDETLHLLDEQADDPSPLIPADEACQQISHWLSRSLSPSR
jgi:hypothetical protein